MFAETWLATRKRKPEKDPGDADPWAELNNPGILQNNLKSDQEPSSRGMMTGLHNQ
jgi:hypothetical protein